MPGVCLEIWGGCGGGLNYECLLCPRREAFKVTPEPQRSRRGDGPGGRAAAAVRSVQLLKACGANTDQISSAWSFWRLLCSSALISGLLPEEPGCV